MALQDDVAVKYCVYTLFCRRVLENMQALEEAVDEDPNLQLDECLQRFSDLLKAFFIKTHPIPSDALIQLFCGTITSEANMIRTGNPAAADVFDQVVLDAGGVACSWSFLPEITSYHDQGRALAQAFFNNLSSSVPPSQLTQKAGLELDFRGSGGTFGFGYNVAPIITFPKENKIILRFAYEDGFPMYLLYLFLFLHEYTGHIFSNDYGNTLISDGWLIFAADEFLRREWMRGNAPSSLNRKQVLAFRDYFLGKFGGVPRKGYDFAHLFHDWLGAYSETLSFEAITYELATFTPQPDEEKSWPTKFFRALKDEFYRAIKNGSGGQQELLSKIKTARDIRELYSMLPPPKPFPY